MSSRPKAPVLIAALPWNLADMISVQVGGLKAFLNENGVPCQGRHYYLKSLDFFSPEEIEAIHSHFLGDHLYALLLFPDHAEAIARQIVRRSQGGLDPHACARRLAELTEAIVSDCQNVEPNLIGFTTTHMQYLASVYTAAQLKAALPSTRIVLGGIALYGDPAQSTLDLFSQIDFVIAGEGETALLRLAEHCQGFRPIDEVPQVLWRSGEQIVTSSTIETIDSVDDLPIPDYSDYFQALAECSRRLTPRATIEMSRGCRWGKCSFCIEGLPSRGGFRSKSPGRVAEEVRRYVQEYRILDYVTSDPDVAFNERIFAAVADLGYDLSFMVEVSGLVRTAHLRTMFDAGVRTLQIGIESFSTELLAKFNKGVSLPKYVELLRMCAETGVHLVYNNIYGAPFETQADIDQAVSNMKRLMFFQPPRLSQFRVSTGSDVINNLAGYGIESLLPAEEVEGYPIEYAERIGMLVSFNAGYGFRALQDTPVVDHSEYLAALDTWRQVSSAGARRTARRGAGFIRVDHVVGQERYHVDVTDELEIDILVFCHALRKTREVLTRFAAHGNDQTALAIERLWERHLLFRTNRECVSLVSVGETV